MDLSACDVNNAMHLTRDFLARMVGGMAPTLTGTGAARLARWREKLDITQRVAAELCGLDAASYCKIERAIHGPGLQIAIRIARATDGAVPVEAWEREA